LENSHQGIHGKLGKRIIYLFLLLLIIADVSYSFVQHLNMPLDGDMAGGIVPGNDVRPVLEDPFGITVLTKNAVYNNPNRFFAHWTFYNYFKQVPVFLQNIVKPIDSVYLACALAKTGIQILLITLLAFFITGRRKILRKDFILAAILIVPLFQTNGYRTYMGIIDPCLTYSFFYALPCALLLLFYLPFFSTSFYKKAFTKNLFVLFFLVALSLFITLNGPLIPGVVLTISLVFIIKCWMDTYSTNKSMSHFQRAKVAFKIIPKSHLAFFLLISLLSIYSLYIGSNNSIFLKENVSLVERYSRIPVGLITILTQKIGFPILLLLIGVNLFIIIRGLKNTEGQKIISLFKWIGIFSLLYILLLPLGGYKSYRPNVIRFDTFMPITIGLIFMYGMSTFFIIRNIQGKNKKWYLVVITVFALIFTFADQPEFGKNDCEKVALEKIAQSTDNIVLIGSDCNLLSWEKITDPKVSELNGQLLKDWNITSDKKLYYQK